MKRIHTHPPERLERVWRRVLKFVYRNVQDLAFPPPALQTCEKIAQDRQTSGLTGRRSFMHAGHYPNTVCVWKGTRLADSFLVGILMHEIGHLATGADDVLADKYVFEMFGLPILYKGPLKLEWVDPKIIRQRRI